MNIVKLIQIHNDTIKLNTLYVKRSELESKQQHYYSLKQKQIAVRARVKWIEGGDIPSKYFNPWKQRQTPNVLTKLTSNDKNIEDERGSLNETLNLYPNLYTAKHIPIKQIQEYFENQRNSKTLTESEWRLREKDISVDEVTSVIQSLKKNKSGIGGLTSVFNQTFWQELQPVFMAMLEETFEKRILLNSN